MQKFFSVRALLFSSLLLGQQALRFGGFGRRQGQRASLIDVQFSDTAATDDREILNRRPKSLADIPKRVLDGFHGIISSTVKQQFYGGEADLKEGRGHVGGFIFNDSGTYEPQLWRWMHSTLNVTKILDVGCGMGISTDFFLREGMRPACLEGSKEAVSSQRWSPYLLKHKPTVLHDFTVGPPTGPHITSSVFDAAWSAEFVEHIDKQYVVNFMKAFQRAHLVFMTHGKPGQGGYHHVNLQQGKWWVDKFEEYGFEQLKAFTLVANEFSQSVEPTRVWSYQRVCSYKGFEWPEDHTLVKHAIQNCHALDGELLCCSGNMNGPFPRVEHHAPPAWKRDVAKGRIEQMNFSSCSKRGVSGRFGTGLVFYNKKTPNNPYAHLRDSNPATPTYAGGLPKEDPLVKHLRAQFVTAEELERQDFVPSRRTCKWTGPKKYEPLAGAWGAR